MHVAVSLTDEVRVLIMNYFLFINIWCFLWCSLTTSTNASVVIYFIKMVTTVKLFNLKRTYFRLLFFGSLIFKQKTMKCISATVLYYREYLCNKAIYKILYNLKYKVLISI